MHTDQKPRRHLSGGSSSLQNGADNLYPLRAPISYFWGVDCLLPSYWKPYGGLHAGQTYHQLAWHRQQHGLAFMLSSSVMSIPAAIAIFSLPKTQLFALYFAVGGTCAFLVGLTCQPTG